MEVNKENLKKWIELIFSHIKAMDTELMSHQLVIMALRQTLGMEQSGIDLMLNECRNRPEVLKVIDERYKLPVETLLSKFDQAQFDQEIYELLQKWKTNGQVN